MTQNYQGRQILVRSAGASQIAFLSAERGAVRRILQSAAPPPVPVATAISGGHRRCARSGARGTASGDGSQPGLRCRVGPEGAAGRLGLLPADDRQRLGSRRDPLPAADSGTGAPVLRGGRGGDVIGASSVPGPKAGTARRLCAALAAVAVLATTSVPMGAKDAYAEPSGAGAGRMTDVGAVVDRVVPAQLEKGGIPGAIVTVVDGGETVFSKGYGVADVDSEVPMDPEKTGFYVASEAKLFTATAALQLVEAGKLDLHTDVNEYLRDFSVPDRYPGSPVTLYNLLTYTSGFDNNIYGWSQWPYERMPSLAEFAASMQPERVRAPGEVSAYNNYDYVLIGRLIEIASGMSFADYV